MRLSFLLLLVIPFFLDSTYAFLSVPTGARKQKQIHTYSTKKQYVEVNSLPIIKVDARDLTRQDFEDILNKGPCILTHAFDDRTRKFEDEEFSDAIYDNCKDFSCKYQIKKTGLRNPQIYCDNFANILGGMITDSCHDSSWYLISEDLLEDAKDPRLKKPFTLPPRLFGELDYFSLFPQQLQPKSHCLILGGTGSRSFLHADPYEWTGLNYLFEGQKLWTFISPYDNEDIDGLLHMERMPPQAWDNNDRGGEAGDLSSLLYSNVSAGWRSVSYDLYAKEPRVSPTEGNDDISIHLPFQLHQDLGDSSTGSLLSGVQEEGELVVIPPHWYHQVYHLRPSLCLAWQFCNKHNLRHVLRHMLEWCSNHGQKEDHNNVEQLLRRILSAESETAVGEAAWARSCINQTLHQAMILRHGTEVKNHQ